MHTSTHAQTQNRMEDFISHILVLYDLSSNNISLVITVKEKAKYRFCMNNMLLLQILQKKKTTSIKVTSFLKLHHHTQIFKALHDAVLVALPPQKLTHPS